ncbi:MAG: MATE family efflux transporter [Nitrospirota bacterium]
MAENISETGKNSTDNLAEGAKGGAIAFILKISGTVLGFLNQVILAKILGAGGLGEVVLAVTVVRISIQIAKFGMEETMMKFIPLYIDRNDGDYLKGTISFAIKFCLLISVTFMLVILAFSKFIAINMFHSEGLLKLMPVAVIAIPAWALRDVIGGILRGYKDTFRSLISESFISPFFRIVIFLILILQDISTLYAIVAFVFGEMLSMIVSVKFLLSKAKRIRAAKKQCDKMKILEVAYSVIFTSMGAMLYTQADIWILGMYTSTETVGIYGVAAKLVLLVYFPMMAFSSIIPPLISSIHSSGDTGELKKVVSESTRWILSTAMPIILILSIEGEYILKYFYKPEFAAGYYVLLILTLCQMVKAGSGLTGVILQMTGGHKFFMKVNIAGGILNVFLNVILVPRLGMIGAALSSAFCIIIIDVICIYVIYRRLSLITIAKGIKFDLVFIGTIATTYVIMYYINFDSGPHLLLGISLAVYIWKTIANHDIPWRLLLAGKR